MSHPVEEIPLLLVEDNPADARLVKELLRPRRGSRHTYRITHVATMAEALAALEAGSIHIALVDLFLPDCRGLDTLGRIAEARPALPIVIMSGLADEETAVEAVRRGAQDYLVKDHVDEHSLVRSVQYAVERKRLLMTVQENVRRLDAMTEKLKRANRDLQDFASAASHELQSPLANVYGLVDLLRSEAASAISPRAQNYLDRIQGVAQRAQDLVRDLLTFSRITRPKPNFEATDLNDMMNELIEDSQGSLDQVDGRIEVEDLPTLECDKKQLKQVFQNLVSNSLKFRKSDRPPRIRIRSEMVNGEGRDAVDLPEPGQVFQILVEDNGIGFDEKYSEQIFRAFQRLHTVAEYQGTGIGLALCRKIIERHHGSIRVKSTLGEGSTFIVSLPARQPIAMSEDSTETGMLGD